MEELAPYLEAMGPPRVPTRRRRPEPVRREPTPLWRETPTTVRGPRPPAGYAAFFRLVPLAGDDLPVILERWWSAGHGVVAPGVRLEQPSRERGSWALRGRLSRGALRRTIRVRVDMWAHLGLWTVLVMTPERRVRASARYFRWGNRVLDRFVAALIREGGTASAAAGQTARGGAVTREPR